MDLGFAFQPTACEAALIHCLRATPWGSEKAPSLNASLIVRSNETGCTLEKSLKLNAF